MITLYQGHVLGKLKELPDRSINCVVTSPPYWGLRTYQTDPQVWTDGWKGELGSEPTPEMFIDHLVSIFAEVKRVITNDATVWINIGDSYKDKCKQLIPQELARGLKRDGWIIRDMFDWYKPNPLPGSQKDRFSTAHEAWIMCVKSKRNYFDMNRVRLPLAESTPGWALRGVSNNHKWTGGADGQSKHTMSQPRLNHKNMNVPGRDAHSMHKARGRTGDGHSGMHDSNGTPRYHALGRSRRTSDAMFESIDAEIQATQDRLRVLKRLKEKGGLLTDAHGEIVCIVASTEPLPDAHFAAFPKKVVLPLLLAGCPQRVCRECGKGWVMQGKTAKKEETQYNTSPKVGLRGIERDDNGLIQSKGHIGRYENVVTPTGLMPTCDCPSHKGGDPCPDCGLAGFEREALPCFKPGVVLDPFLGSGTTAIVAAGLGLECIGIELKPEYLKMAQQRIDSAVKLITSTDAI